MNIKSIIINGNIDRKELIIKTGTLIKKGLLQPSDCRTLPIDKLSNLRVINYGENTMMKKLGVDQVLIAKPCGEKNNSKSCIVLFKDGEDIYQKSPSSNFDGLKDFIKNLRNKFKAKNPNNKNLQVSTSPIIRIEKNEKGKLVREIEYRMDGSEQKLSSIKKYNTKTGILESTTFYKKNDDKKMASLVKYNSETGNIQEKISYAEDGKTISSISTFDPKTGILLKEERLDEFGYVDYSTKYRSDGSKKYEETPECKVWFNEEGHIIEKFDKEFGITKKYDAEKRMYQKEWGYYGGRIIEDYDVYSGQLLKRTTKGYSVVEVEEFNPEAPEQVLKKTLSKDSGVTVSSITLYDPAPPYKMYKTIDYHRDYKDVCYYDSYGKVESSESIRTR